MSYNEAETEDPLKGMQQAKGYADCVGQSDVQFTDPNQEHRHVCYRPND